MAALYFYLKRFAFSTLCLLGLSLAMSVHATGSANTHNASHVTTSKSTASKTKLSWRELTPTQQQTLMPLATEWDSFSTFRQKKWLELADRYAKMSPEAQARMQTRMKDWSALSPEQRRKVRRNYLNSKKLSSEQKAAQWERYQQLPEDKKKKLAASASNKKTIANPPLLHDRKTPILKTPASTSPPVLIDNHQAALPSPSHTINTSNEPDSDPTLERH